MRLALLPLLALPLLSAEHPVFLEKNGIVMIEAESTGSSLGRWKLKTDVPDFSGKGHLEFTGNKPESGPAVSPLKYRFSVLKPGNYALVLRAHKRLISDREDICNDCHVALDGAFESGNATPKKILESDTKMFGGDAKGWGWCRQLDANHKKWDPVYTLKPGETYELTVHGRSQNFNLDAIFFLHDSKGFAAIRGELPEESARANAGAAEDGKPAPVNRTLTHRDGRKIEATLLRRRGDQLTARVNGRSMTFSLDILSEEDRAFIDKWCPE
jgi:hypothetical protein